VPELLFYFLIVTAHAPGVCEEREYTTLEACRRLQRAYDLAPFFGMWFGREKGVSECYAKPPLRAQSCRPTTDRKSWTAPTPLPPPFEAGARRRSIGSRLHRHR
jgi:hypothetical protein